MSVTRRVITRSGQRVRGRFPSAKSNRLVVWESLLERDAILHFEFSKSVCRYREYQTRETYYVDGMPHYHYPDFEITTNDEKIVLVEIKSTSVLQNSDEKLRFSLISEHFERNGRQYRILTDKDLRRQPMLDNLKYLSYYMRPADSEDELAEKIEMAATVAEKSFSGFSVDLGSTLWVNRLIAYGILRFDLNTKLTPVTVLHFADEDNQNDTIQF